MKEKENLNEVLKEQEQTFSKLEETDNVVAESFESNIPKKKKNVIIPIIISLIILTGIFIIRGICLNLDKKPVDPNIEEENPKITLETAKEYLKENYDKFNIDGSTSMVPLHQALNNKFSSKEEKEVKHSKTVDSFEKFIKGENDILLGVTYSDELLDKAKTKGVNLGQKEITREGFVFIIDKKNPVKSLTIEEIKDIYSGKITNWKEVGGPDARIVPFQRNDDSGSQIRMNKLMGDTKLVNKVYVADSMGELILNIADFRNFYAENAYAIGYNMYTFTEKQYFHDDVELLKINGIKPTDDTIFDESYPIIIYNYVYYNKNNKEASEFVDNLYTYLMSDEGQKLISNAGYVNLNMKYDRNNDIDLPYEEIEFKDYYDKEKQEFYNIDINGNLLVFKKYSDFMLHDSKYKNNKNAVDFYNLLFKSDMISSKNYIDDYRGKISISGLWFDMDSTPLDVFSIRYKDLYYGNLTYHVEEDKYVLNTYIESLEYFDGTNCMPEYSGTEDRECLEGYPVEKAAPSDLEITHEELKDLYIRDNGFTYADEFAKVTFSKRFKIN